MRPQLNPKIPREKAIQPLVPLIAEPLRTKAESINIANEAIIIMFFLVTPRSPIIRFTNNSTERLHIGINKTADEGTMNCKNRSADKKVTKLISNSFWGFITSRSRKME